MTITISYEKGSNPLLVYALEAMLDSKRPTAMVFGNIRYTCDKWPEFLSCMWKAFAKLSKESHGWAMTKIYSCSVDVDSGMRYGVSFFLSKDYKGIQYGSVQHKND